eukprot:scaffold781_cov132-Cylindrotheca_fusiformis.AAC.2
MNHFTSRLLSSLLLLLLQLLIPSASSSSFIQAPKDVDCNDEQYRHTLQCWLYRLQLPIPDQNFDDWKFTLQIRDMTCSELEIQNIRASVDNASSNDTGSSSVFHVQVGQVAATCQGKYHVSGGISGKVKVHVSAANAAVSQQENDEDGVKVSIELEGSRPSEGGIVSPFRIITRSCETHLSATSVHFTGSMSAKLIQAFEKPIRHYITDTLQETICPTLPQQIDPLVNQYIQQFNDWKQQYMPSNNATLFSNNATIFLQQHEQEQRILQVHNTRTNHRTVNPLDWAVPQSIFNYANDQLERHLQRGWFPFNSNEGPCADEDCAMFAKGISGWIPERYQRQLSIPIPAFLIPKTISYGPLEIVLPSNVVLSGIQDLQELQTTKIFTNHSLVVKLSNVQLTLIHSQQRLTEFFDVALNISSLESSILASKNNSSSSEDGIRVSNWDKWSLKKVIRAVEDYYDNQDFTKLSCLIATIDHVELSQHWLTKMVFQSLTVTPVNDVSSKGELEHDLDQVISQVSQMLLDDYSQLWTLLSQGLIQGPGRQYLNQSLKQWLQEQSKACPSSSAVLSSDSTTTHDDDEDDQPWWIDFTKWKFLYRLNDLIQNNLNDVNHYLDCLQRAIQFFVQTELENTGMVDSQFYAEHWNTLTELQVLRPEEPKLLTTKLAVGDVNKQAVPQATFSLHVDNETIVGNAVVNVTLFASAKAQSSTQVEYNLNDLENISLATILQHGQCGMVPTNKVQVLPLTGMEFSTIGVNVSIQVQSSDHNATSIHISSLDYGDETALAMKAVEWSVGLLRTWINTAMKEWSTLDTCPWADPSDGDSGGKSSNHESWMDYPLQWIVAFVLIGAQVGVMKIAETPIRRARRRNEERQAAADGGSVDMQQSLQEPLLRDPAEILLEPASMTLEEQREAIDQAVLDDMRNLDESLLRDVRQQMLDDQSHEGDERTASSEEGGGEPKGNALFKSEGVPEFARFALPICVVGTIVLLISSNLSVGASVDLSLRLGDENHIRLPGLFEFSLVNTITEFYRAGIYPLLFLVLVFSGIWPYAKLLFMLRAWLKPHPRSTREERLLNLDAFSKFSLVDTYVLVVMVVAFRFHLDIIESFGIDFYVTPEFGFYSFLLATCLSLLLGHGMIYFHRRDAAHQQGELPDYELVLESVLDHSFTVRENGSSLRLSRLFQVFVFSCCVVALVFLPLGFGEKSFVFEIGGLAGLALGDDKRSSYSLLSLGAAIPESVENPGSIGIVFLQGAYYFYAVVTPIICLLSLTILFAIPLPLSKQRSLLVVAEIANAWSAVEVFVLSICAALFQISTFASFIIGDKCDLINSFLRELAAREDIVIPNLDGDSVCFTVQASVDTNNFWFLKIGVIVYSFVISTGLKISQAAVKERIDVMRPNVTAGEVRVKTVPAKLFKISFVRLFVYGSAAVHQNEAENYDESDGASAEESEEPPEWRHWF